MATGTLAQQIEARERELQNTRDSIAALKIDIERIKRETGSRPRATVNELNRLGRAESDLRSQLQILKDSKTTEEAASRQDVFKRQTQEENIRQALLRNQRKTIQRRVTPPDEELIFIGGKGTTQARELQKKLLEQERLNDLRFVGGRGTTRAKQQYLEQRNIGGSNKIFFVDPINRAERLATKEEKEFFNLQASQQAFKEEWDKALENARNRTDLQKFYDRNQLRINELEKRFELAKSKGEKIKALDQLKSYSLASNEFLLKTALGLQGAAKFVSGSGKKVYTYVKTSSPTKIRNDIKKIDKTLKNVKIGRTLKNIDVALKESTAVEDFINKKVRIAKINPVRALIQLGGEVFLLFATGEIFKLTGQSIKALAPVINEGKVVKVLSSGKKGSKVVKFVGSQKKKGGSIVTELVFETEGRAGIAKGVTTGKTKKAVTRTVGKIGKIKKGKVVNAKTFVGVEKVIGNGAKKTFIKTAVAKTKNEALLKLSRSEFVRIRNALKIEIKNLKKELKQFKGATRYKKLKGKLRKTKGLTANEIRLRKVILRRKIRELEKKLRQFKGVTRVKKIKGRVRKEIALTKNNANLAKEILRKERQKIINELKNFKGVSRVKKIKGKIGKTKKRFKFKKNSLEARLQKINRKLGQTKTIKRAREVRKEIKKRERVLKLKTTYQKNVARQTLRKLERELKQFKGATRYRKIKIGASKARRYTAEEIRFRINSLKIRLGKAKARVRGSKLIREFKGTKRIKKRKPLKITRVQNIKKLKQFSTGKIKLGGRIDDIISSSDVFTNKDLSLIIGKTITKKGDKIKFIGVIKGTEEIGGRGGLVLSTTQQRQFKKALRDVVATASSVARASKVRGLSTRAKSIISRGATKVIQRPRAAVKPRAVQRRVSIKKSRAVSKVKQTKRAKNINSQINKSRVRIRTIEKEIAALRKKARSATTQKQKSRIKTKIKERLKLLNKQKSIQKQRLSLKERLIQKQRLRVAPKTVVIQRGITTTGGVPRIPIWGGKKRPVPIPKPRLKAEKGFKILRKPAKIFSVVVRKRKRAVVLLDKLIEKDALNFMAFELDMQLLRTARLKHTGTSKKVRKLPKKYDGAFQKRKRKLRQYKIQKKKRVAIKGFIEKKRFALDTPSEREQLRRLQKRKKKAVKKKSRVRIPRKKKVSRRKPIKRKVVRKKAVKRKRIVRKKSVKKKVARKKAKRRVAKRRR